MLKWTLKCRLLKLKENVLQNLRLKKCYRKNTHIAHIDVNGRVDEQVDVYGTCGLLEPT